MRYIHRVGRTARQGKEGKALTLLLDQEESLLCSDFGQGAVNGRFTYIYIYMYIYIQYTMYLFMSLKRHVEGFTDHFSQYRWCCRIPEPLLLVTGVFEHSCLVGGSFELTCWGLQRLGICRG